MVIKIFANHALPAGVPEDFAFADGKLKFHARRWKASCSLKSGESVLAAMDMATLLEYTPTVGKGRMIPCMVSKFDDDSRPAVGDELVLGAGEYVVSGPADVDGLDGSEVMALPGKMWTLTKA